MENGIVLTGHFEHSMSGGEEDIAVRQYPQIIRIGRFVLPHHLVVFHHKYDSLRIIGSGKRLGLCKQRRGREQKRQKRNTTYLYHILYHIHINKKEYPKLELTKKSVLSQISSFPKLPFIHKYILFFLSLLDVIRDRSNS